MYRLKPTEAPFEVVDGPFVHRKYDHSGTYPEIPPDQADKFEGVGCGVEGVEATPDPRLPTPPEDSPEGGNE